MRRGKFYGHVRPAGRQVRGNQDIGSAHIHADHFADFLSIADADNDLYSDSKPEHDFNAVFDADRDTDRDIDNRREPDCHADNNTVVYAGRHGFQHRHRYRDIHADAVKYGDAHRELHGYAKFHHDPEPGQYCDKDEHPGNYKYYHADGYADVHHDTDSVSYGIADRD